VGRLNAQIDEAERSAHKAVEVHEHKPAAAGTEPTASTGKGDGSGKATGVGKAAGNAAGKGDGAGQPKPGKKTAGGAP
jgi:hypothetical protein